MFKVLAVLAVAAVVLGLGVHYGRDRVVTAVHDRIDTGLPDEVEAHSWAPLRRVGRYAPIASASSMAA